jgi:enoyl-CoA hydratase
MEMMLLCDVRIAASDTRMALPETGLGMIPGVAGTQTLPRAVGLATALDVTLTGRTLDARAAQRMGLVHRVVPRALLPTALAAAAGPARAAVVQAIRRACERPATAARAGIERERRLSSGYKPADREHRELPRIPAGSCPTRRRSCPEPIVSPTTTP